MAHHKLESAKTRCPHGHPYDEANTRFTNGQRQCRACISARGKAKRRAGGRIVVPFGERTHCPKGHAYDAGNTRVFVTKSGGKGRACIACEQAKWAANGERWERNKNLPERVMWNKARYRARKRGVPFTIKIEDIKIPAHCPVLGLVLQRGGGRGRPNAPSLDRIEASKGYVPGNVVVISLRANRIKNDASLEELERVTAWLRSTLAKAGG